MSMSVAAWALARQIMRTTGSAAGGLTAAALFLANPNLLYLQSTPMTEPLLFATTMLAVALVSDWVDSEGRGWPHAAGLALTAAVMTRYEAWPIGAATVVLAAAALLRRGVRLPAVFKACAQLSIYPAVAVILFVFNSRWTTGHWFVSTGFFVAENEARGQGWLAWRQVRIGTYQLSGWMLVWPAYAAAVLLVVAFVRSRVTASCRSCSRWRPWRRCPGYAYVNGHRCACATACRWYSPPLRCVAWVSVCCRAKVRLLPRCCSSPASLLTIHRSIAARRWSSRRSATTPTAPGGWPSPPTWPSTTTSTAAK
jgi:hypothetical protein